MSEDYRILSIETSGKTCGVAISSGDGLIGEYNVFKANSHDKILAESIKKILNDTNTKIDEINAVALSSGPGSFTGLRIGAAIAKGLCFNNEMKLIAVPTLSAIAHSSIGIDKECIAVIPSNKELYYYQTFDNNSNPKSEILLSDFNSIISQKQESQFITGIIPNTEFLRKDEIVSVDLTAGMIARSAAKYFEESNFVDSEQFTPMYVQDFIPKTK